MPSDDIRQVVREVLQEMEEDKRLEAARQRIRANYQQNLDNLVADYLLIEQDEALDVDRRQAVLDSLGQNIVALRRRIKSLDAELNGRAPKRKAER